MLFAVRSPLIAESSDVGDWLNRLRADGYAGSRPHSFRSQGLCDDSTRSSVWLVFVGGLWLGAGVGERSAGGGSRDRGRDAAVRGGGRLPESEALRSGHRRMADVHQEVSEGSAAR